MNFSPFGSPFPTTVPGIHQFTASGALVSNASTVQVRNETIILQQQKISTDNYKKIKTGHGKSISQQYR